MHGEIIILNGSILPHTHPQEMIFTEPLSVRTCFDVEPKIQSASKSIKTKKIAKQKIEALK